MDKNIIDHKTFLEQKYKKRRRMAIYKLLASIIAVIVFFHLAWHVPRTFGFNMFSMLAGGSIVFFFFEIWGVLQSSWRILRFGKTYPQYIYEIGHGLAFFEEKDIKMCEEFAAHGYRLSSVIFGLYKFERALPEECDFSVDITDIKATDTDFGDYLEKFAEAGWQYTCSCSALHYFRAPKGQIPMFSDNADLSRKYKKMRSLSVWCVIAGIFTAIGSFLFSRLFPHPISLMFQLLMGVGIGLSLAMSVGVILNQRLIVRLKRLKERASNYSGL